MAKKKKEQSLKITQLRSLIGRKENQKRTMKALGLKRIRHTVVHQDTPQIRGMIAKVDHLVSVEEVQ
ncbi:MAG: 50S ribosomal protein L30 [Deferribacteres bacterium]|nr:50S ribosomal protein L30 [candidate division KSB1 bacterium]MCB9511367.1 50S ribosomal protein L30 [Deferribacteres bacterium]